MKFVVKKFRKFLDTEFEIKPPNKKASPKAQSRSNYVNPFKHQQELQEKQHTQTRPLLNLKKPEPKDETLVDNEPKTVTLQHPQEIKLPPIQSVTQVKHQTQKPKLKRPSFFDKKLEITIQKPTFKLPKIPKPTIVKPTPKAPQRLAPIISKPVPQEVIKSSESAAAVRSHVEQAPAPQASQHEMTLQAIAKPPEAQKYKIKLPNIHSPKGSGVHALFKPTRTQGFVIAGILFGFGVFGVLAFSEVKLPMSISSKDIAETAQLQDEQKMPAEKLAESVGKKTELPSGETPESATISDITKLKGQDFFEVAQNGDKILMYKRAQKVYLYRPSTDEVIAIAPLVFKDQEVAGESVSAIEQPHPTADQNAPKTSVAPEPPHGKVLVPAKY